MASGYDTYLRYGCGGGGGGAAPWCQRRAFVGWMDTTFCFIASLLLVVGWDRGMHDITVWGGLIDSHFFFSSFYFLFEMYTYSRIEDDHPQIQKREEDAGRLCQPSQARPPVEREREKREGRRNIHPSILESVHLPTYYCPCIPVRRLTHAI